MAVTLSHFSLFFQNERKGIEKKVKIITSLPISRAVAMQKVTVSWFCQRSLWWHHLCCYRCSLSKSGFSKSYIYYNSFKTNSVILSNTKGFGVTIQTNARYYLCLSIDHHPIFFFLKWVTWGPPQGVWPGHSFKGKEQKKKASNIPV